MVAKLKLLGIVLAMYLLAWCTSYFLVMVFRGDGMNFRELIDYLGLAWSFSGGEIPMFVWFGSLVIFAVLITATILARRFYSGEHHNAV